MAHWIHLHPDAAARRPTSMVQGVARLEREQHRLRATETPSGGLKRPRLREVLLDVLGSEAAAPAASGEFAHGELDAVLLADPVAISVQAGRASNNNQALIAVLAAAAAPGVEWLILVVPDRYNSFTPYIKVVEQLDSVSASDGIDLDLLSVAVIGY